VKKPQAVVVEWTDASYSDGPIYEEDMKPLVDLVTCGWLVRQNKTFVTLAMEYSDDSRWRAIINIPRVNITRIRKLRG